MTALGKARLILRLGPHGWARLSRTALVSTRIERSLRNETLDQTARRFGATLSFELPQHANLDLPLNERERLDIGLALAVLRRPSFNGSCLRRALVMGDILRDRDPILRVGVAKADGEVVAHAWIEIDGYAVDPMAEREYTMLRTVTPA